MPGRTVGDVELRRDPSSNYTITRGKRHRGGILKGTWEKRGARATLVDSKAKGHIVNQIKLTNRERMNIRRSLWQTLQTKARPSERDMCSTRFKRLECNTFQPGFWHLVKLTKRMARINNTGL